MEEWEQLTYNAMRHFDNAHDVWDHVYSMLLDYRHKEDVVALCAANGIVDNDNNVDDTRNNLAIAYNTTHI